MASKNFSININLDNAAFHRYENDTFKPERELSRVLENLSLYVGADGLEFNQSHTIRDINGNTIGHAIITIEEE